MTPRQMKPARLAELRKHPREAEHENLHAYCLHLWAPVGFDPLPDFRFDGGGV